MIFHSGNRAGVLQGQSDYPLTDVGRQQAKATGRRLLAEWHSIQSAKVNWMMRLMHI